MVKTDFARVILLFQYSTFKAFASHHFHYAYGADVFTLYTQYLIAIVKVKIDPAARKIILKQLEQAICLLMVAYIGFKYLYHSNQIVTLAAIAAKN